MIQWCDRRQARDGRFSVGGFEVWNRIIAGWKMVCKLRNGCGEEVKPFEVRANSYRLPGQYNAGLLEALRYALFSAADQYLFMRIVLNVV